jgi:hypothetical protein
VRETLPDEVRSPSAEPARPDEIAAEQPTASAQSSSPAHTYTLFGVKRLWRIAAVLCLVAAAVLDWRGHLDATFVAATLGVVAWFLDQRNLLRARSIEADADTYAEIEEQDER